MTCLHFDISSVLLLRMFFPLSNVIFSFSFRQRLHLSDERLKRKNLICIFQFITETKFQRFIFQNSCESSVLFLYNVQFKDLLWLLYLFLYLVSAVPISISSPYLYQYPAVVAYFYCFCYRFCVAYVVVGNVYLIILKSNGQPSLPHFCCMVD